MNDAPFGSNEWVNAFNAASQAEKNVWCSAVSVGLSMPYTSINQSGIIPSSPIDAVVTIIK